MLNGLNVTGLITIIITNYIRKCSYSNQITKTGFVYTVVFHLIFNVGFHGVFNRLISDVINLIK